MSTTSVSCVRNASRRRAMLLVSTHSRCNARGPRGTSTGRVLSDRSPMRRPSRHRGYLDRDLSWIGSGTDLYGYSTRFSRMHGQSGTRYTPSTRRGAARRTVIYEGNNFSRFLVTSPAPQRLWTRCSMVRPVDRMIRLMITYGSDDRTLWLTFFLRVQKINRVGIYAAR